MPRAARRPRRGRRRWRGKDLITPMHGEAGRPALRDRRAEGRKYRVGIACRSRSCWSRASCPTRSRLGSRRDYDALLNEQDVLYGAGRSRAPGPGHGRDPDLRHRALDAGGGRRGCPSGMRHHRLVLGRLRAYRPPGLPCPRHRRHQHARRADRGHGRHRHALPARRRAPRLGGRDHAARGPLAAGQHDRAARARAARQGAGHRRHGADRAGAGAARARLRPRRPLPQPHGRCPPTRRKAPSTMRRSRTCCRTATSCRSTARAVPRPSI